MRLQQKASWGVGRTAGTGRDSRFPLRQMVAVLRRRAVPGPVLAISEQPARRLVVSIALLGEEDARGVDAAEVEAQEALQVVGDGDARDR